MTFPDTLRAILLLAIAIVTASGMFFLVHLRYL